MTPEYLISEHQLQLGEVSLNYAVGPKTGDPLVMLHGITNWWKSFESVMPEMGSRWRWRFRLRRPIDGDILQSDRFGRSRLGP